MSKPRKINYEGTDVLEVLEGAQNYNSWIAAEVGSHLAGSIIEIGSGIGTISSFFFKKNISITDKDRQLVQRLRKKYSHLNGVKIFDLDVEIEPNKSLMRRFDSIFAVNVLEHIDDDSKALINMHKLLVDKGKIVLLVPAKKRAFTSLDKKLGHFRRYEKENLKKKLEAAGFSIDHLYFFNFVGLFSWVLREKLERNNLNLRPTHIAIFDKIVPVLRFVETKLRPIVGISLIVVATKKT